MRVLLAASFFALAGCVIQQAPPSDPCHPSGKSPCTEPDRTLCVIENGNARCLCNAGFIARPSGACEPVSAGNCPEHQGDGAEPDDCMARARAMAPSDNPRNQSIDPVGDYDFVAFNGTARFVYVITAKAQGALFPRLDVYDQAGLWLATDERTGQAQLAMKAPATAPFYVRVSQSPVDPSVATGGYTLTLASSGQEDHGDGPSEATPITAAVSPQTPTATVGRFEVPGDQDWFSFAGATNQAYRVTFDGAKGAPPLTALYTASSLTKPKWTAQQPIIDFDVLANETAYLAIYAPTDLGSYAFMFTRAPK